MTQSGPELINLQHDLNILDNSNYGQFIIITSVEFTSHVKSCGINLHLVFQLLSKLSLLT